MISRTTLIVCVFSLGAPLLADITVDGGGRPVVVKVPQRYDPARPTPLLIELHAYRFSPGSTERSRWGFHLLAESEGFLYAGPSGLRDGSGLYYWDATDACCANYGGGKPVDDSSYLRLVIDQIRAELNVDPDRIYVAGFSNGGFMAHRMACDHADIIAAAVSQSGATWEDPDRCVPAAPVHVLEIHGDRDNSVLYGGGTMSGFPYPGSVETVERWATLNGCSLDVESGEPVDYLSSIPGAETVVTRYRSDCQLGGSAELWRVQGAGHGIGGSMTAGGLIVDYLLAHPKRPPAIPSFTVEPLGGLEIAADALASVAPADTEIGRFVWDFGDGESAEGPQVEHTYHWPGRYVVSLTLFTVDGRYSAPISEVVSLACESGEVSPWRSADVGTPLLSGGASRIEADGSIAICAGGKGITGSNDEFRFVYQEVARDFELTANVREFAAGRRGAAVGLMFRGHEGESELPATDERYAALLIDTSYADAERTGTLELRYRNLPRRTSRRIRGDAEIAALAGWVRLVRRGSRFAGWISDDGESWTLVVETELEDFPRRMFAGVVAYGRDSTVSTGSGFVTARTIIDSLQITPLPGFIRGDCNGDGETIGVRDALTMLTRNFLGDVEVDCLAACDADADGDTTGTADALVLLTHNFLGGVVIPAPFPECGAGPLATDEELGCGKPQICP